MSFSLNYHFGVGGNGFGEVEDTSNSIGMYKFVHALAYDFWLVSLLVVM